MPGLEPAPIRRVYCILKFPEPEPVPARQRILYTQNARVRAGFYSIAYTCILKFPGLLPVLQRILYTQISKARACSCSTAYTYILKFPESGSAPARQRILIYSNFQSPGSLLLGSVYCILKFPGLGPAPVLQRILYTQISRAQARSCSAAYTVYSNFQNPGLLLLGSVYCILKFPGPGQFPR